MKPARTRDNLRPGYISYLLVISTGAMLTLLTLGAYKSAVASQVVQAETQLRVDYADKEDTVLRAIVNILPNRAIKAMKGGSNSAGAARNALRWQNIFSEALDQANARTSISAALKAQVGGANAVVGNTGDSALANIEGSFDAIDPDTGYVSSGLNRSLGAGYPVPLQTKAGSTVTTNLDATYPVISNDKVYGNLASSAVALPVDDYPNFNIIPYPEIRFGYCAPGQPFVAKRNWWAFSMHVGEHDSLLDSYARGDSQIGERDFIVSLYEIPSQLAISAEAFTKLGTHADGTPWQHANVQGGVYSTRTEVGSGMHIDRLAARRGLTLGGDVTVGANDLGGNPLTPGVREQFEVTNGTFMPVAVASESGRAAFVPINRGAEYFDRFVHAPEANAISPTMWNNYSVGALQCAMRLDITAVQSATDRTPTALRFQYFKGGERETLDIPLAAGPAPTYPFEVKLLHGVKPSVAVYPERLPAFLQTLDADGTEVNHSLAVNVDYSVTGLNNPAKYRPEIPCTDNDYGLLLTECADLSKFKKGFSVVTNLRMYIGDDYNQVALPVPPAGLPSPFYPPVSLFAPEVRYGTELNPFKVAISGQMGNLKGDDGTGNDAVHLLDLKMASGENAISSNINVNLRPITHPAELPPITMTNWLVVIEERRKMFYSGPGAN